MRKMVIFKLSTQVILLPPPIKVPNVCSVQWEVFPERRMLSWLSGRPSKDRSAPFLLEMTRCPRDASFGFTAGPLYCPFVQYHLITIISAFTWMVWSESMVRCRTRFGPKHYIVVLKVSLMHWSFGAPNNPESSLLALIKIIRKWTQKPPSLKWSVWSFP